MTGRKMNCEEIYEAVIGGGGGDNYVLFEMAACFLGGFDPEKLRLMLRSSDLGLVCDGLSIASEIGSIASNYADDFRVLAKSDDEEVSLRASDLLKVYERSDESDDGRRAR